jgi:hypothetical protein
MSVTRGYTALARTSDGVVHAVQDRPSGLAWAACEGLGTEHQQAQFNFWTENFTREGRVTCLACLGMIDEVEAREASRRERYG